MPPINSTHPHQVAGSSIEEAVILAIHFEQAAEDHLLAHLFGKPSAVAKKISNYTPLPVSDDLGLLLGKI